MEKERSYKTIRVITISIFVILSASCQLFFPSEADSGLILNEVSNTTYYYGSPWIELYNRSDSPVSLSPYTLKTQQVNIYTGEMGSTRIWSLPSITIEPGAYYLVRGNSSENWTEDGKYVCYISDSTYMPFWDESGSIELLLDEKTVDYICFGNIENPDPQITAAWSGNPAPKLAFSQTAIRNSLARDEASSDTNTAGDWTIREWGTPGGLNDVNSEIDEDGDGIPDEAESPGGSWCGYPLYDWGARTGVRDIFINVIYMQNGTLSDTDPGIIPRAEALAKVKEAFASHEYAVHFNCGNLYGEKYNLDNTSHAVPYTRSVFMGDGYNDYYTIKGKYVPLPMTVIAHTVLFGSSQLYSGEGGSSGVAEFNGNDLMVTLGGWGLSTNQTSYYTAEENTNILINYQASTLMHELGHNLGLMHGGGENQNYKPNYYSIMNYMYQLDGLPPLDNIRVGDRYYLYRYYQVDNREEDSLFKDWFPSLTPVRDIIRGATHKDMFIDYSSGTGSDIDETSIDENNGLYQTFSEWVDYDGNGTPESSLAMDLNPEEESSVSTLEDYDDWGRIELRFQNSYLGSLNGDFRHETDTIHFDPVINDRQSITTETLNPPEYLR